MGNRKNQQTLKTQVLPESGEKRGEGGAREQPALSPAEKAAAFRAWAESHPRGLPLLSEEAISRESVYDDEQL
jgi:hypothetical protein